MSNLDICILSDSQAALQALDSIEINSRTMNSCRKSLYEMADQLEHSLCWVSGHRDIPGNCRADELAREGTTKPLLASNIEHGAPLASLKLQNRNDAASEADAIWRLTTVSQRMKEIGRVVGVLTGHWTVGNQAFRMGLPRNDLCRTCGYGEDVETTFHYLCSCVGLSIRRKKYLREYFFYNLVELSAEGPKDFARFIASSTWFP